MGLLDLAGVWQEDQGRIEGLILKYFAAIFKSNLPTSFEASLSAINTRVTPEMNDELLVELKADEVARAINQMHLTKSPGPDGTSPFFTKNIGIWLGLML